MVVVCDGLFVVVGRLVVGWGWMGRIVTGCCVWFVLGHDFSGEIWGFGGGGGVVYCLGIVGIYFLYKCGGCERGDNGRGGRGVVGRGCGGVLGGSGGRVDLGGDFEVVF